VSVIVPARNEEACLGACLQSLLAQNDNVAFEIIVVDDHSTDRTRDIALSFASPQVRVIEASPLPAGWTGKNNAVTAGAQAARGQWLLFTDADTVHLPGSLTRSLEEANRQGAALLSYSPQQIVKSFWERAVMPVIFAELAANFRPSHVSDPNSPAAAANGQYILITREAYDAVGGHAAISGNLLEDVALARAVKRSGRKIFFRYGGDAVRTRMYRSFAQLREGWTKNLALLFPSPSRLAAVTLFWWASAMGLFLLPAFIGFGTVLTKQVSSPAGAHEMFLTLGRLMKAWWLAWITILAVPLVRNATLLQRANFDIVSEGRAAIFGMPMFAYLLLRSKRAHAKGSVFWKGRTYSDKPGLLATDH
jgi:hypothetical protein